MTTRQDFANWIRKALPDSAKALGEDLQKWVSGEIFGVEDKWFVLFQTEGGTQHLENIINQFLDLPSVGYDDFSGAKQNIIVQYQAYVAKAQAVYNQSIQEKQDLIAQLNQTTDETQKTILKIEIASQQVTIDADAQNLATWQLTLSNLQQGKVSEQAPAPAPEILATPISTNNSDTSTGAKIQPQQA